MGQAKQRGTFEERKAAAIELAKQEALERELERQSREQYQNGRPAPVTRPGRGVTLGMVGAAILASGLPVIVHSDR